MNGPLAPTGRSSSAAAFAAALRWLLATVAVASTAAAGAAPAGEIVDGAYVADALGRGAIVWDVRDAAGYAEGHIPGALNGIRLDVKVYEPSWLGYAGMLAAPAEREVFLNVGAPTGRIGAVTGRSASSRPRSRA
jgi:hypothetical protein